MGHYNSVGVGIFVHARWTLSIRKIDFVSDRVMAVDVGTEQYSNRIIVVYMPYAGYSWDTTIDTYDELSSLLTSILPLMLARAEIDLRIL